MNETNKELSNFESVLFSAFSDGWQHYLHEEELDVAQWAKEHSAEILEAAKQSQTSWKPSNKQVEALQYVYQNLNPPLSDKRGWDSLKTLELMCRDLKKLIRE